MKVASINENLLMGDCVSVHFSLCAARKYMLGPKSGLHLHLFKLLFSSVTTD